MEKRAKEFLELSGRLYTTNKENWKKMVDGFDEDVYNDTILKVYDSILKGADTQGDLNGYWFKSFKNNLNRNKDYSHKKKRDDTDVIELLKDKEYEENNVNLYYSTISDILLKVKHNFNRKTFEVFRMYLLCNMSYEQLDNITGLCDCKERISKVRKWLNGKTQV
jgi:hypothetical protein